MAVWPSHLEVPQVSVRGRPPLRGLGGGDGGQLIGRVFGGTQRRQAGSGGGVNLLGAARRPISGRLSTNGKHSTVSAGGLGKRCACRQSGGAPGT